MSGERPGPGHFLRNIVESEAGVARKAYLVVRNLVRRPLRPGVCCGHPGEPGC